MSTVVEYNGLKFKINPNDHNPPHVHVEGRGGKARINLRSLEIMDVEGYTKADMRRILEIIKFYREQLQEKWNEFHE